MNKNIALSMAKTYTEGLVRALQNNSVTMDLAWQELNALWQFAIAQKNFELFMSAPNIPFQKKEALLESVFHVCAVSMEVKALCALLLKNGKFSLLPMMLEVLGDCVLKSQGKVKAFVTSATKLLPEEIQVLQTKLETRLGKKLQMVFQEDKGLIGGFVARVEDEIFDGSIRKQLEKLNISICA
jgi:F-type H+-transporting ATPase subunit delta